VRSFVIYLVVFFFVAVLIRGQKHISSANSENYFHNPYLDKQNKTSHKTKQYKVSKSYQYSDPRLILDISFNSANKLKPIEQKYLAISLKKHLSKRWYTKRAIAKRYRLHIDINRLKISQKKYLTHKNGKRQYRVEERSKIKIKYKVYDRDGNLIINGLIPYKVLVKSASLWDSIEAERLAKKELFTQIGKKLAFSLNKKYYYITQ